jgi:hypothetical protein
MTVYQLDIGIGYFRSFERKSSASCVELNIGLIEEGIQGVPTSTTNSPMGVYSIEICKPFLIGSSIVMTKNKGKGGKTRKRGKNNTAETIKRELLTKEEGQEYAVVTRMLGNGRLEANCYDGKKETMPYPW